MRFTLACLTLTAFAVACLPAGATTLDDLASTSHTTQLPAVETLSDQPHLAALPTSLDTASLLNGTFAPPTANGSLVTPNFLSSDASTQPPTASTPAPASLLLFGTGLAGLLTLARGPRSRTSGL